MNPAVRLFRSDRGCLLLVLCAALPLCGAGLGARDLWDPDEPRTALVTAGIARAGSWAVLHFGGQPWLEKPPLYYWLAAASGGWLHAAETSLRLPSSLAAVLCAFAVFALGRQLFGRRTGVLAALVLVTCEDFAVEARWARPDMLLTLLLTCAALFAWLALEGAGARGAWAFLFWASVGLAILTKGPVGLLPLFGVGTFLLAARRWPDAARLRPAIGLPLALAPVSAWILAWSADAGRVFPLGEVLGRFGRRVGEGLHHPHPVWHLVVTLPLELVPWLALVPAAIWDAAPRRGAARDDRRTFLLSILIAYLVLFAASAEKRGVYLVPLVPIVSLLVGRLWDAALFDWDPHPLARPILAGLGLWLVVVAAAAAVYLPRLAREAPELLRPGWILAAAGLAGAALPLVLWRAIGPGGAISVFAAGAAAVCLAASLVAMPALDPLKSARTLGETVATAAGRDPVLFYPEAHAGIAWYAGVAPESVGDPATLGRALVSERRLLCVAEKDEWEAARRTLHVPWRLIGEGRVGHRTIVLIEGRGDKGGSS